MSPRPTICLNLIVRDEAHVIHRCLDSVMPWIDRWVVVDTGSSDGTQEAIREHLREIPGELHERPWRNFGHNRTEALDLARGKADYTWVIDADEVFSPSPGFTIPVLDADAYRLRYEDPSTGVTWERMQLVRSILPWRFEGVFHEYLTGGNAQTEKTLEGAVVLTLGDGARSRDPEKVLKDCAVLEAAHLAEPDNPRYLLYMGDTCRRCGRPRKALDCYRQRLERGGWAEELWYCLYQIARVQASLDVDPGIVIASVLKAYQFRPTRAEPLWFLARECRLRNEFALAFLFAQMAVQIHMPSDILFVERFVYDWQSLDEYAISAYYVGRHEEAIAANDRLLSEGKLPQNERDRVLANREFSLKALGIPLPDVADRP
jgi:glycosyltransferase involved in cell wall biosynthesis